MTTARSPTRDTFVPATNPDAENAGQAANSNNAARATLDLLAIVVSEVAARNVMFRTRSIFLDGHHGRVRIHVTRAGTVVYFADHCSVKVVIADPMATLTTAAAVPILRDRAILTTDVLVLAFKVIRMTSRTIRPERRRAVVHRFGIALVTFGARQVAAMIKRLIRQADVTINVRCPLIGCMAKVAFLSRNEVVGILAGCDGAVVT